ncbi:hypothetical protein [Streptomyces azureus]|uniref:Uncharacterized protein n=1 Tax=Streptomyces azureus TaxID=146537 RepID=A0A0K8PGV5_STRAJ|nr:hypothetical protein [Streptomyces azureus]GAP47122.1 predicted protein [Streptomyces azureus]
MIAPEADSITVTFEYSTDLFTHETVEAWAGSFTEAPRSAVDSGG